MRYLGVDYGLKKVGLAISEGQIASPLKVLDVRGLVDALNKVIHVINKEQANRIVIGVPESGEARSAVKKFISKLKLELAERPISVIEVDETLSSRVAKGLMVDLNISLKKRQKEDAYSAALILQNFLDSLV